MLSREIFWNILMFWKVDNEIEIEKGSLGVNIWAGCVITNQFILLKHTNRSKKGEARLSFNSETFLHFKLSFLPTLTQSHFIYFQCFSVF